MQSDTVELKIPSETGYEKIAMKAGEALSGLLGFAPGKIEEIKTAISEAVLNSMEHGNKFRKNLVVTVTMKVLEDCLQVEVHDGGEGLKEPLPRTIDLREKIAGTESPRGLGLYLIRQFVDDVEFLQDPDGSSFIRMNVRMGSPHGK